MPAAPYLSLIRPFAIVNFVKSLLKKIYYRILDPLRRLVILQCEQMVHSERVAREKLGEEIHRIQIERTNLIEQVEKQAEYIAELHQKGLHEMLSHYAANKLRLPETVLAAAADVARGMEPSLASVKHKAPAHEIIYWSQLLLKEIQDEKASDGQRVLPPALAMEVQPTRHDEIELLENQLAFIVKNSMHREQASNIEIKRLKEELHLEKHNRGQVVAG